MNKRILKRIMSLVLVVVMVVSTMMVSAVSTSALIVIADIEYQIFFETADSLDNLDGKISIKVNGDNGSTDWFTVGFEDSNYIFNADHLIGHTVGIDVGNIKSVTVKNDGSDGWYPEIIKVSKCYNKMDSATTAIYGGRVDGGKEVTFSVSDRVATVTLQPNGSRHVHIGLTLYDEKGNSTVKKFMTSKAFDRKGAISINIDVPDDFGTVTIIEIDGGTSGIDYIDVELDGITKTFLGFKK